MVTWTSSTILECEKVMVLKLGARRSGVGQRGTLTSKTGIRSNVFWQRKLFKERQEKINIIPEFQFLPSLFLKNHKLKTNGQHRLKHQTDRQLINHKTFHYGEHLEWTITMRNLATHLWPKCLRKYPRTLRDCTRMLSLLEAMSL